MNLSMISFRLSTFIILFFAVTTAFTQYRQPDQNLPNSVIYEDSTNFNAFTFGIGLGLSYGAIGGRFGYDVNEVVSIITGIGYNFNSVAVNGGIQLLIPSEGRFKVAFTAIYGANASSKVIGASEYDGTFYGPSFGIGARSYSKEIFKRGNYWDYGILFPIRSKDFEDTIALMKSDPRIEDFIEPWPILVYIGYNFKLN